MWRRKRIGGKWRSQAIGVSAGLLLAFVPILNGRALPWLGDVGNDSMPVSEMASSKAHPTTNVMPLPVWPVSQLSNPLAERAKPQVNCHTQACVALTFDDGPDPKTTPQIMAALKKYEVPATFFVIGNRVAPNAALLRSMYQQGLEIGNHTWGHPNLAKLTPQQISDEVNRTQAAIAAAGVPVPYLLRPPYGKRTPALNEVASAPLVLWNVDPQDWKATEPAQVVQAVNDHAKQGAIILMHDTKQVTASAAEEVVKNLRGRYQLVTVSQLLELEPSSRGEYFGR